MSFRGGCYRGPGGELLHGDGRKVETVSYRQATITVNRPASVVICSECREPIIDGDPKGHKQGCSKVK